MEHDDDVGTVLQGGGVARLLIPAVATILAMHDHVEAEVAGDFHGLVAGDVVDEDDAVDQVMRDVGIRAFERPRGVVGRHHDDDARVGRNVGGHGRQHTSTVVKPR